MAAQGLCYLWRIGLRLRQKLACHGLVGRSPFVVEYVPSIEAVAHCLASHELDEQGLVVVWLGALDD